MFSRINKHPYIVNSSTLIVLIFSMLMTVGTLHAQALKQILAAPNLYCTHSEEGKWSLTNEEGKELNVRNLLRKRRLKKAAIKDKIAPLSKKLKRLLKREKRRNEANSLSEKIANIEQRIARMDNRLQLTKSIIKEIRKCKKGKGGSEPGTTTPLPTPTPTPTPSLPTPTPTPQAGDLCSDGIDNDGDGKVDAEDTQCQRTPYLEYDPETVKNGTVYYGWTAIEPSADSRVIYVSASEGNDSNDGLSKDAPKKSVAAGVALLRNGYPDHLLFKRGDTWANENFGLPKSGKSAEEPLLIGSYGTGNRPRFLTDPSKSFLGGGGGVSYFSIIGLDLTPNNRASDGTDANGGIKITGTGSDVLIEDCRIDGYSGNLLVQGYNGVGKEMRNVSIRRNVIINAWNSSTTTGLFSNHMKNLLLEENFFDHNGWHPTNDNPDIFSHNIYFSNEVEDTTVIGNIFSRGSSMGTKFKVDRGNHIIKDNLYVRNPVQAQYGDGPDDVIQGSVFQIEDNVYTEGVSSAGFTNSNGLGIGISDIAGGYFKNNIIANRVDSNKIVYALRINGDDVGAGVNNFDITGNTIYGWGGPVELRNVPATVSNVTFTNNTIVDPYGVKSIFSPYPTGFSGYVLSNNTYYSASNQSDMWFKTGSIIYSENDFLSQFESTASFTEPEFTDPTRNSVSFAISQGMSGYDELIEALKKEGRHNWNATLHAYSINSYIRAGFSAK